jgi:hypothetical protein
MPRRSRGIAGCGEPLFPPFRAALVRRTRQAGVAGHGSAVTHRPRQHLIDEHICRFNADADNPSTRTIRNSPARSSPDSPLEGTGFELLVPSWFSSTARSARCIRHPRISFSTTGSLRVEIDHSGVLPPMKPARSTLLAGSTHHENQCGTSSSNPVPSSAESVSLMDWGRCRPNARLLRQSVGGLGREKGRAGR